MARSIAASLRRELERQETGEAVLVFLTITNPDIPDVIRVVSDSKNYVWGGHTYIGFWFDASILSDTEQAPEARITVQNVDGLIGEAIRKVTKPCRLRIDVIPASSFDETQDPRVAKELVTAFSAEFNNSNDDFSASSGATLTPDEMWSLFEQAGTTDPQLVSSTFSIEGAEETIVRIDLERVTARASGDWQGNCYYSTPDHSFSGSFRHSFSDLAVGERRTIDLDMTEMTFGGDDWVDSTITRVRFDLDNGGVGGQFKIHGIWIGHYEAQPSYTADHLYLTDVEVNVLEVMGTVVSWNYTQRSWPGRRASKSNCPALFV